MTGPAVADSGQNNLRTTHRRVPAIHLVLPVSDAGNSGPGLRHGHACPVHGRPPGAGTDHMGPSGHLPLRYHPLPRRRWGRTTRENRFRTRMSTPTSGRQATPLLRAPRAGHDEAGSETGFPVSGRREVGSGTSTLRSEEAPPAQGRASSASVRARSGLCSLATGRPHPQDQSVPDADGTSGGRRGRRRAGRAPTPGVCAGRGSTRGSGPELRWMRAGWGRRSWRRLITRP